MIKNDGKRTLIRGGLLSVLNEFVNITASLDEYLRINMGYALSTSAKVVALCVKMAYADDEEELKQLVHEVEECVDAKDGDG